MKFALQVTPNNLPIIKKLNDGVEPPQECVDTPTYYVWDDTDDGFNDLLDTVAMWEKYTIKSDGMIFVVAER